MSITARLSRSALASASLASLASFAVLAASVSPAAATMPLDNEAQASESALFGAADPTYDGVWRQSAALLAQHAAGFAPAGAAVDWLLGQQCEDGSFLSYRADPGQPCADVTAADTNATAFAVQALAALGGHGEAVDAALAWLRAVQNDDGGWSFSPGQATDAISTAVVVSAFTAAGDDPAEATRGGASPYDALTGLHLGCEAEEDQRGAFAWQPEAESGTLYPNDAATVDAVLATQGGGLLVEPGRNGGGAGAEPPSCDENGEDQAGEEGTGDPSADETDGADEASGEESPAGEGPGSALGAAGAAYLARALADNDQHLVVVTEDGEEQPDYGSTAEAVLALIASGDPASAQGPLEWLLEHHASWEGYADRPAAVGTLVLVAHAAGVSPSDFGGTDLIALLNGLGPAPDESSGAGDGAGAGGGDDGAGPLVWIIGIGLLAGVGIGVALSLRRSRKAAA